MIKIDFSNVISIKFDKQEEIKELIKFCKKNLVLDNPEFLTAVKMGRYSRNISKKLYLYEKKGNELIIPFGCYKEVLKLTKGIKFTTHFSSLEKIKLKGGINLYDYQKEAVNVLKRARNGILKAPCGSGKTIMGLSLIKELGYKALWITHTKDLLNQSLESCKRLFPDSECGTITDGKIDIGKDITFATVQTLCKLDKEKYEDEFNVVIVDECHRCAGTPTKMKQFYKVVNNIKCRYKYGLSATIHRADGLINSTYALLGNVVHEINENDISDKRIKADIVEVDLDTEESEEYLNFDGTMLFGKLIDYLCENEYRNNQIVRKLKESNDRFNLILTHRVSHAEKLREDLGEGSVVTGKVKNRNEIFEKVKNGEERYLFSTYALAKEGLDLPILDRLHLVTPQKDFAIVKQSVGRVERTFDKKTNAEVYDYVDTNIGYCLGSYKKRKRIYKGGC